MSEQDDQSPSPKAAQSLQALASPLSSFLSNLSSSSRSIPANQDFHFLNNFQEFNSPIQEIAAQSQSLLQSIGSSQIFNKPIAFPDHVEITDAYDWLVDVNDEVFERIDVSIDEFNNKRGENVEGGGNEDGFQMVYGKNKKKGGPSIGRGADSVSSSEVRGDSVSSVKVKEKKEKSKVPFHIPTIKRPQEEYNILVSNSNQPFEHVWLERSEDGERFIHPLENFSVLDFVDKEIGDVEPIKPPSLEEIPFKLVEEVKDLKKLAAKLKSVNEFAVDLEHNQYRSFQGLTCLMQISTRTENFVIDTLKLHIHVGPYLRQVFKDPTKKKVMHGADRDIVWLQRDFGIYLCNMFDTGQASRVLKLERNSLEFLLNHFCGVNANKEYQNADWRLRPLPDEMLRYAREDTHYLLYIYDIMKSKLFSMPKESEDTDAPLIEVYKRSYDICMQLYEKELLTENSYLYVYGLQGAGLNGQQLAIVSGLFQWRDIVARAEDESTGYILPNRTLIEIAKQMPTTSSKLHRLLKSKHPYIEHNIVSVVAMVQHSMQNATGFEAIAQQLKEGRIQVASEDILAVNDESEVLIPDTSPNLKIANVGSESVDGDKQRPLKLGGSVAELDRNGLGSFEHPGAAIAEENNGSGSHISKLSRAVLAKEMKESGSSFSELSVSSGSGYMDACMSPSAKVTGATVKALKKPSRGFGALLGNPKRKFNGDKKAKEEMKLEQIKSSVNFPFHSVFAQGGHPEPVDAMESKPIKSDLPLLSSFSVNELTKSFAGESSRVLEIPRSEEPPAVPSIRCDAEDIIMLEDDINEEELIHGNSKTANVPSEENPEGSSLEMDIHDETMSLSDLTSSFLECFDSTNKNRKSEKLEKSEESSGFLQLKPFDFEAARKQIKFGEKPAKKSAEVDGNKKSLVDFGDKKKVSAADRAQKDDAMKELSQGRRRLAFPATGNRSATFR